MNKEYIEREAAVAFLENMAASRYLIQCFEDKEKFPAADVEQVRHGKWSGFPNNGVWSIKCSECHRLLPFGTLPEQMKYCPFCGTLMNGGKSND